MKLVGKFVSLTLILLSLFTVCTTQANLIVNGGFEQTHVKENRWRWFTSDKVTGWSGSNIEIWDRFQGFNAFEGQQHAELNAHAKNDQAFSIFQSFDTQMGQVYSVSFAYAARRNNKEAFSFDLFGNKLQSIFKAVIDDHQVRQWKVFKSNFVAISNVTTLRFTTITPYAGTVGNFIDDVQVHSLLGSKANVAPGDTIDLIEPPAHVILFLGLVAVFSFYLRNKVNK